MGSAHWKLPGYVIEELLGVGATSEVWRARVSASGDHVALKRITLHDADVGRAARVEAAMLSTLDHPHLVRLHDLVAADDAAVLVLDLADGGSLAGLLAQRGRLTAGEVVTALAPVGAALAYAHAHGIVHGDVTPANVLFTRDGRPLLADLGVARIVGDDAPVRSTPAYLDPAVARGGAPGAASDVFMLAGVALHALTGQPVWAGDDRPAVLAGASAGNLADLADRLTGVPRALGELLTRALDAEPARRGTAAEFALDLRHAAPSSPVELSAGRPAALPSTLSAAPAAAAPSGAATAARVVPYVGTHRRDGTRRKDGVRRDDGRWIGARASSWTDGLGQVTAAGRPVFHRPALVTIAGADAQFTHTVRAALRPTLPPTRRSRFAGLCRRRTVRAVAVAGAVVLAAGATGITLRHAASSRAAAPAADSATRAMAGASVPSFTTPAATRSTSAPASASAPLRTAATPATASPPPSVRSAAAVLASLDALRTEAFARNQPALLAGVYVPGALLTQDTDRLARVVPLGCSLVGVRTTYSITMTEFSSPDHLVVGVLATLSPSTLVCGGALRATAAGTGPTALRIELVRSAAGYRIVNQQILT